MKLRPFLISKQSIANFSKPTRRFSVLSPAVSSNASSTTNLTSPRVIINFSILKNSNFKKPVFNFFFTRPIHSFQVVSDPDSEEVDSDDGPRTEFLSRFTFIMRANLSEAYPDCDKQTINGMLLVIIEKVVSELEKGTLGEMLETIANTPSQDFSQDLWKTVWEVGNSVLEDMMKERKKEQMKEFLQHDEVKEMCKFANDIGIRGDMLREFRFKWAREKMEESEGYKNLEKLRDEQNEKLEKAKKDESVREGVAVDGIDITNVDPTEEKPKAVSLPERRGKIKYKLYGVDLSDPQWAVVADNLHEAEKLITPEGPKPITGKCKLVTDKILSLTEEDDPSELLAGWVELLEPSRVDWLTLLDRLKERDARLYFKIAELLLSMEYFEPNIRDYCKLIDAHAKENRVDDAERILTKMNAKGIEPDILTLMILVYMYSKAGNLDRAKEAFENLRSLGFVPDMKAYSSMIMVYINSGQPKFAESLMREMETRDIKPTKEIYLALLKAFSELGLVDGAQRVFNTMGFAEFNPDLESCTLLVEAYEKAGDPESARHNFNYLKKYGYKPDDRCTASMISAYASKNYLDKASNLLMQLEKDGFEPGVATYTVLVDWLGKLKLVDEVEEILRKIKEKGENIPFKVQLSLCDMYSRVKDREQALQYLGIVEGKQEMLGAEEFERIISALIFGGLVNEAGRLCKIMESRGFLASEALKVSLMASQSLPRRE
ncbi:hypothetical protein GIB67_017954 [Kingdonia uniflora]|uniref:PROP1-like PPR domain-containing protein n=1 Tax=Kingdonia uniflora TaxID=39325 RepID=A0A7J7MID2_9MAGN|nr:hypothetical protein GIB67_017954 [Kingdonia uniflora]